MRGTSFSTLLLAFIFYGFYPSTNPNLNTTFTPATSSHGFFNCTTIVDAGDNQVVCAPGETANLDGTITGDFLSASWSPANLVDNPSNLNTNATIDATTTFQLTVRSVSDANLIVNGDFSQGDMNFYTSYIPGTGGGAGLLSNEGQYAIASNAGDTHNQFANCPDHTGGGNMMVVNASGNPDSVWCQDITVEQNTEYAFSAWITSVTSQNPAELQFSINGTLLGNQFNASSSTCSWAQFEENWTSTTQTDITICIVNVNMTPAGNDFALDDISFTQICETIDEVTVSVADLDATWSGNAIYCESETAFALDDLLEISATQGGSWTVNGNAETVFDPGSLGAGTYTVNYMVMEGSCMEENSQLIEVEALPNAGIAQSVSEICEDTPIQVALNDLLDGEDSGGTWTETSAIPSTDGAFISDPGTFQIPGQASGTYTFQYTVSGNAMCADAETTVSVIIAGQPIVDAGSDDAINCTNTTLSLNGDASNCTGCLYFWTTSGGNITSNPDQANITVDAPGTYTLTATSETGCSNTDDLEVTENTTAPVADAGEDINLGCEMALVTVGGPATSIGPQYTYEWTTVTGGTVEQDDIPFTEVEQSGTYLLRVTDTTNGCFASDDIVISTGMAMLIPNISAISLTCDKPNSGVIVVDSVTGGMAPYQYALDDGPFSESSVFANLNAGSYDIHIQDTNGCQASEKVTVAAAPALSVAINTNANGEPPTINLGESIQLDAVLNIAESDVASVQWSPADTIQCDTCLSIMSTPAVTTTYSLLVTDINGCTDEAELSIFVNRIRRIFIPNAFSPNDDGINDLFVINAGNDVEMVRNFLVLDRWGNEVFQSDNFQPNDPMHGWDGKVQGQKVNMGVFVYFAEIEMKDGDIIIEKGEVSLVR